MSDPRIELSEATFAVAFPFGFAADGSGRITVLGRGLARRLPPAPSRRVDELFELVRPRGPERVAEALGAENRLTLLRLRQDGLQLRGQLIAAGTDGAFAFLGTTAVRNLKELRSFDLQLLDFSPQDATPDLLMILQANEASLEDARRLAASLEVAAAMARGAAEAKGRFLAMMSHEIRTPLHGLASMVDVLRGSALDAQQREALDVIDESADNLVVLLNDILDLSRIEAGAVTMEQVAFDPRSACESVVRLFRARAESAGLELLLTVGADVPAWVEGDPMRFRQVAANLVNNAVKFTAHGGVLLELSVPAPGRLELLVKDTGMGVSEGASTRLFDAFVQGDETVGRRFGGTGLGLTISRQLARLMGGDVELLETGTTGSTFRFALAAQELPAPEEVRGATRRAHEAVALPPLQVLVAEDHPMSRVVISRLLGELGLEPVIVENGELAVNAVRSQPFDVVLMDLGMPVKDGVAATRAIRALDVDWKNLPIIAFTAGAYAEDKEEARAAGMDGFLTKPVRLAHLREALVQLTQRRT